MTKNEKIDAVTAIIENYSELSDSVSEMSLLGIYVNQILMMAHAMRSVLVLNDPHMVQSRLLYEQFYQLRQSIRESDELEAEYADMMTLDTSRLVSML